MKWLKRLWLKLFCKHDHSELIARKELPNEPAPSGRVTVLVVSKCDRCGKFTLDVVTEEVKVRCLRLERSWLNFHTALETTMELEKHGFRLDRLIRKIQIDKTSEIEFRQEIA
jgi:hypothetical protein